MKQKSDVIAKLKFAQKFLERLTGQHLVYWFMDQGTESKSKTWRDECAQAGISIVETGKAEHESNGLQEGFWNFSLGCVRSTIAAAGVSIRYWDWALMEFTYIYNRLIHNNDQITPYEALTKVKPDISTFRPLFCIGYAFQPQPPGNKAHPRGVRGLHWQNSL